MFRAVVMLCLLLSANCAWLRNDSQKEKPVREEEQLRLVARVQSRPGQKDFVLLEAYGKWTHEAGTTLHIYGVDGRTATLVTSGEKLGQYVAADISAGQVELGDPVYERVKVLVPAGDGTQKNENQAEPTAKEPPPMVAPTEAEGAMLPVEPLPEP